MTSITPVMAAVAAACIVILPAPAAAQSNTDAGAQIANRGAGAATACIGCHGARGEGNAAANFPRLAGQPQAYLARQLKAYADGSRTHPVMMPIAKALNPQQIDAVSAYYAALDTPSPKPAQAASPQVLKRGQLLAAQGDDQLKVQGCANCHGPGGAGMPPLSPSLAGQHASYLAAALGEWKSGARNTDPSMQMPTIAKRLSDWDIAAVASYYASLPAPAPAAARTSLPARTSAAPPAPGQPATPVQGVGTEQGTATGGGNQGPGGGGGGSGSGPSGTTKK